MTCDDRTQVIEPGQLCGEAHRNCFFWCELKDGSDPRDTVLMPQLRHPFFRTSPEARQHTSAGASRHRTDIPRLKVPGCSAEAVRPECCSPEIGRAVQFANSSSATSAQDRSERRRRTASRG